MVAGTIQFGQFDVVKQPNFVDYLKNGWYINMTVAIDFTASNGVLHHVDPDMNKMNDYEIAIQQVGKILQPYSYKQKFTAFGFGGIPHYLINNGQQNRDDIDIHCFGLAERAN